MKEEFVLVLCDGEEGALRRSCPPQGGPCEGEGVKPTPPPFIPLSGEIPALPSSSPPSLFALHHHCIIHVSGSLRGAGFGRFWPISAPQGAAKAAKARARHAQARLDLLGFGFQVQFRDFGENRPCNAIESTSKL
ncbi:hypothetical protein Taro_045280 [Colocasia esculenta]|uniref:Uncharacterized protein n=1 Tax=Colocasia esculenta TaxID=4460 RepID=A0A843WLK8_COLES|nr:hypothetical protein [Colocasia esculenta]